MMEHLITGKPRWQPAREAAERLREMPRSQAEANVQHHLRSMLNALFPKLPASELESEKESGAGPIDVYCRNVVFETKRQGKLDARRKPDGSIETPEEQAVRYLDALTVQPNLFTKHDIGWRACVTDGKEWSFYDYDPSEPKGERLAAVKQLNLVSSSDDDDLVGYLYSFVDRSVKLAPPTDDEGWAKGQARAFVDLAVDVEHSPAYDVKRRLWRDLLRGAFIIPPGEGTLEELDLFARHTTLVVMARAVADTILPPTGQSARHYSELTDGFAAWLLDAAGERGITHLDALIDEIGRYDWQASERDTLKDLYHSIIPRSIRHDFGEYYTPDWLARAVCEAVMDKKWRTRVIEDAIADPSRGAAVLDPACGSGTFLYHATQLLLEEAVEHPQLADNPEAQVDIVNGLVAGIDLHPVAVELAKTTTVCNGALVKAPLCACGTMWQRYLPMTPIGPLSSRARCFSLQDSRQSSKRYSSTLNVTSMQIARMNY